MSLIIYDLAFKPLCDLDDNSSKKARALTLTERINGVNTLSFEVPRSSNKLKYLQNENIIEFENEYYFIQAPTFDHSDNGLTVRVECRHLCSSLEKSVNQILEEVGKSPLELMLRVLKYQDMGEGNFDLNAPTGTGWSVGTIAVGEGKYRALETKDQSSMSNLIKIAELFGGMLKFNSKTRTVDLVSDPKFGISNVSRNTTFRTGVNLKSVNLTYDTSEMVTKLYVYGGDSEDGSGEISIMDVNPTGKSYIYNFDYYLKQGFTLDYINSNPHLFIKESSWSATNYVDPKALYDDAVRKLEALSKPKAKGSFTAIDLSHKKDYRVKRPVLGEKIIVKDDILGMEFKVKVLGITVNYETPWELRLDVADEIEYNSVIKDLVDASKIIDQTTNGNGTTRSSRLQGAIDTLKTRLNSVKSHWYTDKDGNIIFESEDGQSAMKLGGGIFGIANHRDEKGEFDWSTFGDGTGFTADCITVGTLKGDLIEAGSVKTEALSVEFKNKLKSELDGLQQSFTVANGKLESKISSVSNSVDSMGNRVYSMSSSISQLANQISSKVDEGRFGSLIQQNANSIKIAWNNISSGVTITPSGITVTNGSISASTIKGGTISGVHIEGSVFDGEHVNFGNINCDRLHASGHADLQYGLSVGRDIYASGVISCGGEKKCIQHTENHGDISFYSLEFAESYLGDKGFGQLVNGECRIDIDPRIVESVNTDTYYHVHLDKYGECEDIWTEEMHRDYFIVKGKRDIRFGWSLEGKRRGHEKARLDEVFYAKPREFGGSA